MEKLAFFLYLSVLVIAPLLFGAVHAYAYTLVYLLIFSATSLLLVEHIRNKGTRAEQAPLLIPVFLPFFFTFLAFLFLQILPLPEAVLSLLSPQAKLFAEKSLSTWPPGAQTASTLSSLAPYTYPVQMSIIRWIAYGFFFLGFSRTLTSKFRIETAIGCILSVACFISLYGIFQTYSGSHHIWWFTKTAYIHEVTGTYINRNHFASFMGMALILAACYACSFVDLQKKKRSGIREKLHSFLENQQYQGNKLLIIASATVIGFGLILSASRGAILSTAAGLIFLGILFLFKKNNRSNARLILAIICLVLFISVLTGVEHPWDRFQEIMASHEIRSRYTRTTLDLFATFPLFGVGLGNFRYAYPLFQSNLDNYVSIEYAHNDWIQLLAETGIAGFMIFLSALLCFFFILLRLWQKKKQPYSIALGTAPLVIFIAVGIHSYYDFSLHIPANFLIMSAIVIIGYKGLLLEGTPPGTPDRSSDAPSSTKGSALLFLLTVALICGAGFGALRHILAEANCNTVQNSTFRRDHFPPAEKIRTALSWQNGNASYWYKLSSALEKNSDTSDKETDREIIHALQQAIRLNPMNAEYHLRLGWELNDQTEIEKNNEEWHRAADESMERAAFFTGGQNPWLPKELGDYWLYRSSNYPVYSKAWEKALTRSLAHYKNSLSIQSDYWKKMLYDAIEKTINRHYRNSERPDFMHLSS